MSTAPRPIRLVSIPARHPYVDAVRPDAVATVRPGRTSGWDPDPLLHPEALMAAAAETDLVHLHFGFDDLDVPMMRRWLQAMADSGLPLVFTAHDLRNPHHPEPRRHDGVLAELLGAAAAVVTLTPGAAAELRRRWGVRALVVPHPSIVDVGVDVGVGDLDGVATERGLVVLHLKSLRRNVLDPVDLVRAAAAGAADAGGRLRVDLHPDARTGSLQAALATVPGVELRVHPRFDDLELQHYLRRAHVTVLPYRWGTHSGWLELARDLGTRVVAPSCGHYTDQWSDVVGYVNDETRGLDANSLRGAVATAVRADPPVPADPARRAAERRSAQDEHLRIYRDVLSGSRAQGVA